MQRLRLLTFVLGAWVLIGTTHAQNIPNSQEQLRRRLPAVLRWSTSWPQARGYETLLYDTRSENLLMLGGGAGGGWVSTLPGYGGVWSFSPGSNRWNLLYGSIPLASTDMFSYDKRSARVIAWVSFAADPNSTWILGPIKPISETWAFDPATGEWENRNPAQSPPAGLLGEGAQMVYDDRSGKTIMFGGLSLPLYEQYFESCDPQGNCDDSLLSQIETNHTWVYDYVANTWTDVSPPALSPPSRNSHALVYDTAADRVILFGGGDAFVDYNDTWAYNYKKNTWTQLSPATQPLSRSYGYLAYDSEHDRIVLFGGVDYTETQIYGDTWVFNYWDQTWTQLNPKVSPSPRGWFGMGCSPKANRIVIFGGGTDRDHFTDETWTYRLAPNKWDQVLKP